MPNQAFSPALMDPAFSRWKAKNIVFVRDLYSEGNLMSFQHLQPTYDLPSAHFFRFLHIRNQDLYAQTQHTGQSSTLIRGSIGTVTFLYDMLMTHEVVPTDKLKNDWEIT